MNTSCVLLQWDQLLIWQHLKLHTSCVFFFYLFPLNKIGKSCKTSFSCFLTPDFSSLKEKKIIFPNFLPVFVCKTTWAVSFNLKTCIKQPSFNVKSSWTVVTPLNFYFWFIFLVVLNFFSPCTAACNHTRTHTRTLKSIISEDGTWWSCLLVSHRQAQGSSQLTLTSSSRALQLPSSHHILWEYPPPSRCSLGNAL